MNDMERMKSLIDKLNAASEAYYSGEDELMSDHEWNDKFDELTELENKTGIILENSPTHKVSDFKSDEGRVKHEYPALSLPKSKDVSDVLKWSEGRPVDLSWKLDGLTLVVTYDDGKLVRVVTRGDGEAGDDITHLSSAIANIQPAISYKGHLVIRGEAVISYADFEQYNSDNDFAYENARNLASGSCNPKRTADAIAERNITWIPFNLVHIDEASIDAKYDMNSWHDRMEYLKSIGFNVVESVRVNNDLAKFIAEWSDKVADFEYPVDGLVIVYDDIKYAATGTLTGHHDTKGGYAFKWQDEEAETELLNIEWSISINSINPVAIYKPVRLEGTTVQRASLCNLSECKRLGIGGIGTKLTVIKANKIIPKVIAAEANGVMTIPKECPVCGYPTEVVERKSDKNKITEVLVCTNHDCVAKHIRKLTRFVSKHGFDIQGLSKNKLMDLVQTKLISNCADTLRLPEKSADVKAVLCDMDGWGNKSVDNLLTAIEKARKVKASNLIYSLCIPMCGRDVAKRLVAEYDVSEIITYAISGNIDAFMLDGVGEVKARAILDWFANDENRDLADDVMMHSDVIGNRSVRNDNADMFKGITFAVTGKLENYASRDLLKEEIELLGGKVAGSVSAKTTYLINNDVTSTSGKNKDAKKLGIRIISEAEYIKLKNGESI